MKTNGRSSFRFSSVPIVTQGGSKEVREGGPEGRWVGRPADLAVTNLDYISNGQLRWWSSFKDAVTMTDSQLEAKAYNQCKAWKSHARQVTIELSFGPDWPSGQQLRSDWLIKACWMSLLNQTLSSANDKVTKEVKPKLLSTRKINPPSQVF